MSSISWSILLWCVFANSHKNSSGNLRAASCCALILSFDSSITVNITSVVMEHRTCFCCLVMSLPVHLMRPIHFHLTTRVVSLCHSSGCPSSEFWRNLCAHNKAPCHNLSAPSDVGPPLGWRALSLPTQKMLANCSNSFICYKLCQVLLHVLLNWSVRLFAATAIAIASTTGTIGYVTLLCDESLP
jgi:hypothetical protein